MSSEKFDRPDDLFEKYDGDPNNLSTLLSSKYLLARHEASPSQIYEIYYAPIASRPAHKDRVVFVGLTPGLAQMKLAASMYREMSGKDRANRRKFKKHLRERVAFAGSMRTNLCTMLDEIGLPRKLDSCCTSSLFTRTRDDISMTSAIVYPAFENKQNFSGRRNCMSIDIFDEMIRSELIPRLQAAPNALIIPLGVCVEQILGVLEEEHHALFETKHTGRRRVLTGLPHPSGANVNRQKKFDDNRDNLAKQVRAFYR